MNSHLFIDTATTGKFYALFYLLAFLVGFVLLMLEGHKRKYDIIPWMMVIATAFLFFMLGCRIITFSKVEWKYVLGLENVPYSTGLSVLGGILFSIPGILLARKCLRFRNEMVDAFAFVLPVALMIQRLGCLMAGCCYGTLTDKAWGIQYGMNSHAFAQHTHDGLLTSADVVSRSIHPVQVYEVLACAVIILILTRLKKSLKSSGNLFLSSVGLYGLVRFILEFVRASGGHAVGGKLFFSLNYVQWAIFLILPILTYFIFIREMKFLDIPVQEERHHEFFRSVCYFITLICSFLFLSRWLSPLEIVSFNVVLVPMLCILVWYLFRRVTVPGYRAVVFALPLLALVLMSQTLPPGQSTDSTRFSYSTLGFGIGGGDMQGLYGPDFSNTCNGPSPHSVYTNNYSVRAIGFTHQVRTGDQGTTFKLSLFDGKHSENVTVYDYADHHDYKPYGVNAFLQKDRKKIGYGLGFTAGDFIMMVPTKDGSHSSIQHYNIYPSLSLRLGELTGGAFFEYKFSNQFPSSFPSLTHQYAVGFGTTRRDKIWRGGSIRFGTASNTGFFIAPTTAIGESLLLEIYLGMWGPLITPYDHTHNSMAAVSLHVKFNQKGVNKTKVKP